MSILILGCGPQSSDGADESANGDGDGDGDAGEVCEVEGCVQLVGSCDAYESSCSSDFPCMSVDASCEAPLLCAQAVVNVFPEWVDQEDFIVDIERARCFMAALRDRTPGRLELVWGDPQGFGTDGSVAWSAQIYSRGDGKVSMVVTSDEISADGLSYDFYATNDVQLQPVEYFAACVDEPTEAGLIACFWAAGAPVLQLPWLTEECGPFAGC